MSVQKQTEFIPRKLSPQEIKNPHLVIFQFFDYAGLPRIREYLWEWLKITVSGTYNSKLLNKDCRFDMIYFYEHIEKLVEAAYIIHTRQQKTKKKKKKKR